MAKKKNIEAPIDEVKSEVKELTFDFGDKDIVILIGTGAKGFVMSPKKEYPTIGKVAKALIKKGAAILKS